MAKRVNGVWLPDNEEHLVSFLKNGPMFAGAGTYQLHKFAGCFPHIKTFRHAVDVGAHCGLWSRILARCFGAVSAFEPVPEHQAIFWMNVTLDDRCDVRLYTCALGRGSGEIKLVSGKNSSGDTHVVSDGETATTEATVRRLDDVDLGSPIDFLKIDCEGFERFVLEGGEKTIRRDRPCIIVEQKPRHSERYGLHQGDAVDLLKKWGATLRFEISGDFCLSWK